MATFYIDKRKEGEVLNRVLNEIEFLLEGNVEYEEISTIKTLSEVYRNIKSVCYEENK